MNQKKVLWIRDSFGNAMAPLMAATFSETLQLHHRALAEDTLMKLIPAFRPDYVFIMTVERDAIDKFFTVMPPA